MIKKTPTVTIGIPAYNEAKTLRYLLASIAAQKQTLFTLRDVMIVNDGSTDKTVAVVKALKEKYPMITFLTDGKRKGKAWRLNQISKLFESDFLLLLDADVVLGSPDEVNKLINRALEGKVSLVAANIVLVMGVKTFTAKILYTNSLLWNTIRNGLNGGDSIYNTYGSASLLRKSFAKAWQYPEKITCDEGYLYVKAREHNGFCYAADTVVYNRPVATLKHFFQLGSRSITERQNLVAHFGHGILALYHVPHSVRITAAARHLLRSPIYTILAILLNGWLKLFPS